MPISSFYHLQLFLKYYRSCYPRDCDVPSFTLLSQPFAIMLYYYSFCDPLNAITHHYALCYCLARNKTVYSKSSLNHNIHSFHRQTTQMNTSPDSHTYLYGNSHWRWLTSVLWWPHYNAAIIFEIVSTTFCCNNILQDIVQMYFYQLMLPLGKMMYSAF